ncbi:acyltransferase family protein, partial [Pantoea septica]|uniref:acyltransferase family protein n=1 Tax=Pantoea septica TaxID=472695 RepID=UPI00289B3DFC
IFNRLASLHGLLFALGIALVLYPVFTYSTNTTFPGINALMPVIGSMLIILSGDKAIAGHALASRPASYIGEISYSLYLVHWPVVVFTQYILVKEFSGIAGLLLVIASFALAIPMHRFIEKPLRKPGSLRLSGPAFCLSCAGIAMSLMATASSSWADKGWVWRLPEEIRNINSTDVKQYNGYLWRQFSHLSKRTEFLNNGKEKLIITGDSQSADILNMLIESGELDHYDYVLKLIYTQCRSPYVEKDERQYYFDKVNIGTITRPDLIGGCNAQMNSLMNPELLKQADKIYIAMKWYDQSVPNLIKTVDKLHELTNAKIYIFGNKFLSKSSIDLVNSFGRLPGIEKYSSRFHDKKSEAVNEQISKIRGSRYVNMMKLTCPKDGECHVLTDDMQPVFFDSVHLSQSGAKYLGPNLQLLIDESK